MKPEMNQFVMCPALKDGETVFRPMQVIDVAGDRLKLRSPFDFDDVKELSFSDVKLGTNWFDAALRAATDVERRDALRAAIDSHKKTAIDATKVQRRHTKCVDDLERLESHLPVLQDA